MWKPIAKNVHGLIDYAYGLAVPFLPEALGFTNTIAAKNLCRVLGAGAISYSLLTKADWGLYRLIPFRKHLLIDLSVSMLAIAAPWVLGFSKNKITRNTLIGVGAAGIAAAALTDPAEKNDAGHHYLFI